MEDQRWLRFITIGLVLAAVAVGYLLVSQRFAGNKVADSKTNVLSTTASSTPQPIVSIAPIPSPGVQAVQTATPTAYQKVAERTQGGVQALPSTGFPVFLAVVFSAGIISAGWGLKKFPH